MAYRLKELKADSFRGFVDLHIPLDQDLVVIGGPNGSGKSSSLNAVAWAIAGKAIAQKKLGVVEIPERKGWQIVHDGAKACQVSLLLEDGPRRLQVRRSSVRDQCEVKGAASKDDALAALGLTLETFLSTIFLPQELLRIPVALDPKDRGRIFLDLVGLGGMGELEKTLQDCVKVTREKADAIQGLRKSLDDQLLAQVSLKRRDIEDQRERARKAGFAADLDAMGTLVARTCGALSGLCERHGAPPPSIPDVRSLEDLLDFEKAARESLSRIESASPDAQRRGDLERKRLAIVGLQEEEKALEAGRRELSAVEDDLTRAGSVESLSGSKAAIEEDLLRLQEEIARADAQGALLDSALAYFERLAPAPGPLACPVCDARPIDPAHAREHLRLALQRAGVEPLRQRKAEQERALAETQAVLDRHARWRTAVQGLSMRSDDLRKRVGELRGKSVEEDVAGVLQEMIERARRDLDEILGRIAERGKDVQKVRDELEGVAVVRRIQEDVRALGRLEALPREPSYQGLTEQGNRAQVLLRVAEGLRNALKEERRRAFDAGFSAVQGDVVRWFRRITDRPDCRSLRIDSERWSLLEDAGQGEREVTATFNVGDLTSVALAIFLATATRAAHDAGFILLDDPTQGLDDDHKRRLAEVLGEIARDRQVVVVSADDVFLAALEKAGTAGRLVHRLRARAPGRACEVDSSR